MAGPPREKLAGPAGEAEVWAVEVTEGAGSKGNLEVLAMAYEDSLHAEGRAIVLKLVNVTTAVPCGLGGQLAVDQVDQRTVKAFEVLMFKKLVAPLLASSVGKKACLKYVPVRSAKREEGLLQVVRKMKASRLYMPMHKGSSLVGRLALELPGGCTAIGVCGGRKLVELTAASVDVFDSVEEASCGSASLPIPECDDAASEFSITSLDTSQRFSMCTPVPGSETATPQHPNSTPQRPLGMGSLPLSLDRRNSLAAASPAHSCEFPTARGAMVARSKSGLAGVSMGTGGAGQSPLPAFSPLGSADAVDSLCSSMSAQFVLERRSCMSGVERAGHAFGAPFMSPGQAPDGAAHSMQAAIGPGTNGSGVLWEGHAYGTPPMCPEQMMLDGASHSMQAAIGSAGQGRGTPFSLPLMSGSYVPIQMSESLEGAMQPGAQDNHTLPIPMPFMSSSQIPLDRSLPADASSYSSTFHSARLGESSFRSSSNFPLTRSDTASSSGAFPIHVSQASPLHFSEPEPPESPGAASSKSSGSSSASGKKRLAKAKSSTHPRAHWAPPVSVGERMFRGLARMMSDKPSKERELVKHSSHKESR